MNDQLLQMIATGKIPYRYEVDPQTGLYFGLAVLAVIVVFAVVQALTAQILK